jgi:small-conductance mechanosensitive channel
MSAKNSLFISILKATMIVVSLWLVLVLSSANIPTTRASEGIFGILAVIIPIGAATWWLFRKRQMHAPRREARTVAVVFAVFAPLALMIAIPVAQIPGSYASLLWRPFGLIGAVVTVWVLSTLICFACCSIALWTVRRREDGDIA